jgi:hypothetical protein
LVRTTHFPASCAAFYQGAVPPSIVNLRIAALSQRLALLVRSLTLPEDVTLAVDIDPVDLA